MERLGSLDDEEKLRAVQFATKILETSASASAPASVSTPASEPKTLKRLPQLVDSAKDLKVERDVRDVETRDPPPCPATSDRLETAREDHKNWWKEIVEKEREAEGNVLAKIVKWLKLR